jgi:hypothetical protein
MAPAASSSRVHLKQQSTNTISMEKKSKAVTFTREKETKNTVKFSEVQTQGEAPIIGTLHVQKWFAGDCARLKVTVEPE